MHAHYRKIGDSVVVLVLVEESVSSMITCSCLSQTDSWEALAMHCNMIILIRKLTGHISVGFSKMT